MKKQILLLLLTICAVCVLAGCQKTEDTKGTEEQKTDVSTVAADTKEDASSDDLLSGTYKVAIEIEDYGTIEAELDADTAPVTVTNFMKLVNEGFYDGLTFHRIIDGFMIQGGDPLGNGTGGSSETIKGEFSENGVENNLSHTRGAISMARSSQMDSASSQFFIVQADSTYLDGSYACFGYVTKGIEIVDQICEDTKVEDGNGTVNKENQPIIKSITDITE